MFEKFEPEDVIYRLDYKNSGQTAEVDIGNDRRGDLYLCLVLNPKNFTFYLNHGIISKGNGVRT